MNFTPQETKLIERLRKQDRQWRRARWVVLVTGPLCIGLCGAFGYLLHMVIVDSEGGSFDGWLVLFIVVIWTKACFFFVYGFWCLTTVCLKWHGDVNRMLLLKLLDAQQTKGKTPE